MYGHQPRGGGLPPHAQPMPSMGLPQPMTQAMQFPGQRAMQHPQQPQQHLQQGAQALAPVGPGGHAMWSYGQSSKGSAGSPGGGYKGKGGGQRSGHLQDSISHSNVFVGNLPEGTPQAQLEQVFSEYGAIESCFVATKAGRTYGFVKLSSVEAATRAIQALNGQSGWLVKFANKDMGPGGEGKGYQQRQPQAKATHSNVFVGNLHHETTEAKLEQVFAIYGQVDSCIVMTRGDRTYGFVEFSTIPEAQKAIAAMNGQSGLTVRFANSDRTPANWDEAVPHSNLFIGNLPEGTMEAGLEAVLARYGGVMSCTIKNEGDTGRKYGFVKLGTIAAAKRAIKALDDRDGWSVKCANNDVVPGGKGVLRVPGEKGTGPLWPFGGWIWRQPQGKGPPTTEDKEEPEPHDNLYVKGLPPGIIEEEVSSTFAAAGDVVECRVLRWDGLSECAALVRMASAEQATKAREELDGSKPVRTTKPIEVAQQRKGGAVVPDHCFVKGLHCTTSQDQLTEMFTKHGTVLWCRILPLPFYPTPHQLPDCCALVQMSTEEEAETCIRELSGRSIDTYSMPMQVRYAELRGRDGSTERPETKPNSNLYVKGWPVGFPDFLLQSVFQQYGTVVRLRLLENPENEQPTCAALVQMAREEEATAALNALHRQTIAPPVPPMHVRHSGKDQIPTGNLYVSSLPRTITEQQLRDTFRNFGPIVRLKLLQQEKSPEMHARVELSSAELAVQAVRELDGTVPVFKGPVLHIQYATKREVNRQTGQPGGKGIPV